MSHVYTDAEQEQYLQLTERLEENVAPRAMNLLRRVRDICRDAGMRTDDEPFDMSSDDYRWSLRVWRVGASMEEDCIDISVQIAETREYGDNEEHPFGVNFSLDIVEWGGRILGGLSPYNYTPQCWVDLRDDESVLERWQIIEQADLSEIPKLCEER